MQKSTLKIPIFLFCISISTGIYAQKQFRLDANLFYQKIKSSKDPLVIDVRPAYKFQENRIKDAVLAENQEDLLNLLKIVPKSAPVFLYCQYGDRSKRALKCLRQKGFTNVLELEDGLDTWIEEGLPLDTLKLE